VEQLRVDKLSHHFGGVEVLRDIDFGLDEGERVGLIGPNGAGKSTFINILSGVLAPTSGQIYFEGAQLKGPGPFKFCRAGIGRSFQINSLFNKLSVKENALLALRGRLPATRILAGRGGNRVPEEAQQWFERLDLWRRRDEPVGVLSYGEQRFLEVILALMSEPKLLLLDEPSAGLSNNELDKLLLLLDSLPSKLTVFLCGHDMRLVFSVAPSRTIVLHRGHIVAEGNAEQIKSNAEVREIYLGADLGHGGLAHA
jgi:branched-chain amino acid transport system ATP-binding protein